MGCFGYATIILFLYNFERLAFLPHQMKKELLIEIDQLMVPIEVILLVNIIFTIYVFYNLSHQIFWHSLFDRSWSTNN